MKKNTAIQLIACALSAYSSVAHSLPIVYSEAMNGELSGSTMLTLGTGQNTVSGTITQSDFDQFSFVVPQSTTVNSISYSFSKGTVVNYSPTVTAGVGLGLSTGSELPFSPPNKTPVNFTNDASPKTLFPLSTPLGSGTYSIGDYVHNNFMGGFVDYTYTLSVQALAPPPPPPPTTSDLAKFSQIAYGNVVGAVTVGGKTYNQLINSATGQDFGFDSTVGRAVVYVNANNIVIAFKGTSENKDVYSDTSWNTLRLPSPNLTQFVTSAANLLRDVQRANPGKEITLTGHSLGGAVAQLLGAASGLNTETFNAPGTAELIGNLRNALAPVDVSPKSLAIENHRVYGDVVSKAGSEIGVVVTHASPIGEITNSCNTLCSALYNHKISTALCRFQWKLTSQQT